MRLCHTLRLFCSKDLQGKSDLRKLTGMIHSCSDESSDLSRIQSIRGYLDGVEFASRLLRLASTHAPSLCRPYPAVQARCKRNYQPNTSKKTSQENYQFNHKNLPKQPNGSRNR